MVQTENTLLYIEDDGLTPRPMKTKCWCISQSGGIQSRRRRGGVVVLVMRRAILLPSNFYML